MAMWIARFGKPSKELTTSFEVTAETREEAIFKAADEARHAGVKERLHSIKMEPSLADVAEDLAKAGAAR